jgi:hypothetical protein
MGNNNPYDPDPDHMVRRPDASTRLREAQVAYQRAVTAHDETRRQLAYARAFLDRALAPFTVPPDLPEMRNE